MIRYTMSIVLKINEEEYEGEALKKQTDRNLLRPNRGGAAAFIAALEAADETRPWLRAHKRVVIDIDEMEVDFDGMRLRIDEIGNKCNTSAAHIAMYQRIVADLATLHLRCVVAPNRYDCLYIDPFAGDQRMPINIRWIDDNNDGLFTFLYQRTPSIEKYDKEFRWADVVAMLAREPLARVAQLEHERAAVVELIDTALRLRRLEPKDDLLEKTRRLVEEIALMPGSTTIDDLAAQFTEKSLI